MLSIIQALLLDAVLRKFPPLRHGYAVPNPAPRDYTFETTKDSGTLGQCNSPLSVGQVMTYINLTSGPQTASATISADGASVYAVHVNGYVFAASSTTTTSLSGTLLSATGAGSTTSPTSSATISSASSPSTGSLSIGVKAGIGVGVGLGVLGLCSLFVTFCLIQRRWKKAGIPDYSVNVSSPTLYSAIPKGNDKPLPVAAKEERYEMWQPTNEHELG